MTGSITIIGAGRVGEALAKAFFQQSFRIDAIISTTRESAESLANQTQSEGITDIPKGIDSDYIIIAVPDSELIKVAVNLGDVRNSVVMHTAGSYGINVFKSITCRGKGVLYPLQTFTPGRNINIREVPLLIEGECKDTVVILTKLAGLISDKVFEVEEDDRKKIHLAAVFVCNFVNHLFSAGEEISITTKLPGSVLYPLIDETISKAREIGTTAAQTGPAMRNDELTIEKHIDLLSYSPELRDIYIAITRSIIKKKPSE